MNEHSDLNVSYMPLFEDRLNGEHIESSFNLFLYYIIYNIRFTVKIFYVKMC